MTQDSGVWTRWKVWLRGTCGLRTDNGSGGYSGLGQYLYKPLCIFSLDLSYLCTLTSTSRLNSHTNVSHMHSSVEPLASATGPLNTNESLPFILDSSTSADPRLKLLDHISDSLSVNEPLVEPASSPVIKPLTTSTLYHRCFTCQRVLGYNQCINSTHRAYRSPRYSPYPLHFRRH